MNWSLNRFHLLVTGLRLFPMRAPRFGRKASASKLEAATDFQTQMESLLDSVWQAEKSWRLMDRIDLAVAVEEQRRQQRARRGTSVSSYEPPTQPRSPHRERS